MKILPSLLAGATLVVLALLPVAACSSTTIVVHCVEGQSTQCSGTNGCSGTQVCNGGSYGACQCADTDASVDANVQDHADPPDTSDSAPPLAGIGDPCNVNGDCASGMCATPGGVTGWCTKQCAGNSDCAGSHNGKNYKGQTNVCFPDKSNNYFCYAGCSGKADCADFQAYGSTVCGITNNSTLPYCAP